MKKKLLALLMATTMSMALIACGGGEEEATTNEVATEEAVGEEATEEVAEETADVEYTEEQAAFVDEFNTMVDDYNTAIDVINATPELAENQELVDIMNTLTDAINEVSEICEDPSLLTEENMELLRTTSFVETYKLIDQINAYAEGGDSADMSEEKAALKAVFTTALAGTDDAENTYWFLFDDELTFGAFVILSADQTQSVNVVGEITSREDGALVITDETTSSYIAFTTVEQTDEYLKVAVEEGNEVTLVNYDLDEAIDVVVAIDENTEIIE